jgi:Alginate lyase
MIYFITLWDGSGFSWIPRTSGINSRILLIVCSSILIFLAFVYPNHISAEDKRLINYTYHDLNSKTLQQMTLFELPLKDSIKDSNSTIIQDLLKQLLERADSYLLEEANSVMDKKQIPPSGDKHDFLSLAPFHWPDDTKPNGTPYIYRDGQLNPEASAVPDRENLGKMIGRVKILSVAYYYTGVTVYANKTSELLRTWFINNDTRMNPSLQYSEVITGKNNGTRSGIIAANYFPMVLDAIRLIEDSPAWTKEDQRAIEIWFDEYLEWLLHSNFGNKESKQLNNHGTWFDVQAASIAMFLNRTEITRDILENNMNKLISEKIRPDGAQPFELNRHTSLNYHIFNLLGFFNIAKVGGNIGIDLWNYETPEGSGLKKALDYLLPFALGDETWPYKQIKPIDKDGLHDLICQAIVNYRDNDSYSKAYRSLDQMNNTMQVDGLIYGCASLMLNN